MLVRHVYSGGLRLYPGVYRREFGNEMLTVFVEAHGAVLAGSHLQRTAFVFREISGLIAGALREHVRHSTGRDYIPFRRFGMHREYRFPKTTPVLMALILFAVIMAIVRATQIELSYGARLSNTVWPSLPIIVGIMLLVAGALVAAVLGVMSALQRSGVQRLANLESWTGQK